MKTILVPTDFSNNADNAFNYALGLNEGLNANIILFHSCHIPALASGVPLDENTVGTVIEESAVRLKNYLKEKKQPGKHPVVQEMVVMGMAVDMILQSVSEKNADLIIMGTKGASGLEEILLGSNTAAVMEKSPCSVIAVPEHAKYHGLNRIIFATDYGDSDIPSIKILCGIASLFHAEIMVVHVSDLVRSDDFEADRFRLFEEKVRKEVAYKNFSFHLTSGLHADKALQAFIEKYKVDLISLSTRKRNLFTKLFDRSLTKKLAYHTHVPILSIHV